jgi:hypothetical protein
MTKNKRKRTRKPHDSRGDIGWVITTKMPAWMRQTLAVEGGIDREFTISELTQDQRDFFNFTCHIADMEKAGLIEIVYDPKVHEAPLIVATEKGLRMYGPDNQ